MTDAEFDALVDEGFRAIPEKFRNLISNVVIVIEDEPSAAVRAEMNIGPEDILLGLYTGAPLTERGTEYGVGATYPDTITLYKKPILEEANGEYDRARIVVAETIWHEFAHYFGMDEDEVLAREEERNRPQSQ